MFASSHSKCILPFCLLLFSTICLSKPRINSEVVNIKCQSKILVFSNLYSKSQEGDKDSIHKSIKNTCYFEIMGSAFYYSINYERIFSKKENLQFMMRLGLSVIPYTFDYRKNTYTLPITISALLGKRKSKLELGLGVACYFDPASIYTTQTLRDNYQWDGYHIYSPPFEVFPNLIVGYRYQPKYSGFMFRIAFTPFLNRIEPRYRNFDNTLIIPFGGISIGYAF
jgi:hypothetical protein